jgi:hypothetical protein
MPPAKPELPCQGLATDRERPPQRDQANRDGVANLLGAGEAQIVLGNEPVARRVANPQRENPGFLTHGEGDALWNRDARDGFVIRRNLALLGFAPPRPPSGG